MGIRFPIIGFDDTRAKEVCLPFSRGWRLCLPVDGSQRVGYNPHSKAVFTPGTPWRSHFGDSRSSAETVAFLAHVDGWSDDGLVAYMQRYALDSEREARFRVKFVRSPMFRSYTFTYFYGERLLRR